jgi:acetyltransferase-like isoleucine patch superfamily enzyme
MKIKLFKNVPSLGRLKYKVGRFIIASKFYFFNSFATNFPCYRFRNFYLKNVLKIKIGNNTSIHMGCFFAGNNIEIGNNTVVNRKCYFDGRNGKIHIKNNVSISPGCYFLTDSHSKDSPQFSHIFSDIVLNDYAWIGVKAILLPNVNIGIGAVLGAGSVATKDIPDHKVYAGVPASFVSDRNNDLQYTLKYFPYFNTDIE